MAIAIYTRYSTEMQSTHSSEDQERNIRRHLDQLGIDHTNAVVIHDRAESGTNTDRPVYQELMNRAARREFTILAVDEQSRLSRADNVISVIKDLVYHGVRFISRDGVDTNDKTWKMRGQLNGFNNSTTVDLTAERVRRGMAGLVLRQRSAGDYPFGYESVFVDQAYALSYAGRGPKPEKRVQVCPAHAGVVIKIFEWCAEGKPLSEIAKQLEADGAPRGPRVKHWSAKLVRRILGNEKYRGHWVYGMTTFIKDSTGRKKQIPGPPEEVVRTERPELAIIPPELDQRVRFRLAELDRLYGQKPGQKKRGPVVHPTVAYPNRLLLHVLRCEACGAKLHHVAHRATTPAMRQCASYGVGCSARTQVPADAARQTIIQFFAELLRSAPGWLQEVSAKVDVHLRAAASSAASQLNQLRAQILDCDERRENLFGMAEKAKIDPNVFAERLAKLDRDKSQAENRLRDAEALCAWEATPSDPTWLTSEFEQLAAIIEADEARASQLIGQFAGTIMVRHLRPEGGPHGGRQWLIFRIQPWQAVLAALEGCLPTEVSRYLASEPDLTGAESPEFCLPVLRPDRYAAELPQILAMRAAGESYSAIERATGLSWYKVKQACLRHAARRRLIDESRGGAA